MFSQTLKIGTLKSQRDRQCKQAILFRNSQQTYPWPKYIAAFGASRLIRTRIGLLAQPESMRSIVDTTQ